MVWGLVRRLMFMDASGMIHDARDVAMASEQKGNKSVIEPIHDSKISDDIELCKKLLASIERTVPPPVDNWRWDASGRGGSLLGCVMLEVRWSLAAGTLYRVLSDGFTIGCALIVRELLRWMMENAVVVVPATAPKPEVAESMKTGALWTAALCVSCAIYSFAFELHMWYTRVAVNKAYQMLLDTLFSTVSGMHSAELQGRVGMLQQLHGTSCRFITDMGSTIQSILVSPFSVAACMYFLWLFLDWPGLLVLPVMIVVILAQGVLSGLAGGAQQKLTSLGDDRLQRLTEAIQAIRIVKFMSWEDAVASSIHRLREEELPHLGTFTRIRTVLLSTMVTAPIIAIFVVFGVAHASSTRFDPQDVLSSLLLVGSLRVSLFSFPMALMYAGHAITATSAIESLATDSHSTLVPYRTALLDADIADGDYAVVVTNASIFSSSQHQVASDEVGAGLVLMRNVSFRVPRNKITAVCGPTGSGKSLLLQLIGGECFVQDGVSVFDDGQEAVNGIVRVDDEKSMFAVGQESWMFTATVRENILAGLPMDDAWYQKVISVCQLDADLVQLERGDLTVVGERGVTVSGGQRQRIAIARAAYSIRFGTRMLLFDDPLASVDVAVGQALFFDCIVRFCAGTTRVMSTHKKELLPYVDHIVLLDSSRSIVFEGSPDALRMSVSGSPCSSSPMSLQQSSSSLFTAASSSGDLLLSSSSSPLTTSSSGSRAATGASTCVEGYDQAIFTQLGFSTMLWYIQQLGYPSVCATLFLFAAARVIQLLSELSLVWWTTRAAAFGSEHPSQSEYFSHFAWFSGAAIASATLMVFPIRGGVVRCAKKSHDELLDRLLGAPLRTFDTTPTGTLIAIFAESLTSCDQKMAQALVMCLIQFLSVIELMCLVCYGSPWLLLAYAGLFFGAFAIVRYAFPATRTLLQLEDASRCGPTDLLVEYIGGISAARTSGRAKYVEAMHQALVRRNYTCQLGSRMAYSWQSARTIAVGVVTTWISLWVLFAAFLSRGSELGVFSSGGAGDVTYTNSRFDGLPGAMLAVALVPPFGTFASLLISFTSDVNRELSMAENMRRCMKTLPQEDDDEEVEKEPDGVDKAAIRNHHHCRAGYDNGPATVPHCSSRTEPIGSLKFVNVSARYAPHLPIVLRQVSFTIPAGSHVGVVGRTGSGKSSLGLAMMRLLNISKVDGGGHIFLDGRDTACGFASRRELRKHFSMIPQDPILFTGTIRSNLDPYRSFTDEHIWRIVEKVEMQHRLADRRLETAVTLRGGNFSQGERQLLCLARALLKPQCCVVILDEATASVDAEKDAVIQRVVRDDFRSHTVICIAHRLRTVIRSDLVLVMQDGTVAEFDSPRNLLSCLRREPSEEAPKTSFAQMISSLSLDEGNSVLAELFS